MNPIAIDPPDCGCTECITGEYVPLLDATPRQITDMLAGRLGNNTGCEFSITFTGKFDGHPKRPFSLADAETVTVTTTVWARSSWYDTGRTERTLSWEIDPAALIPAQVAP